MTTEINNDINSLNSKFRVKFDARWKEVIAKYPNAVVFETRRSQERQNRLYAQWRTRPWKIVTWTLNSNHKDWNAVDIVFRNNGKIERAWPYDDLIVMAKKYGIRNLAPKELCHFEDDWTTYKPQTDVKSEKKTVDPDIQLLIDNWIWNGVEWDGMTDRIGKVIWKLFAKLK